MSSSTSYWGSVFEIESCRPRDKIHRPQTRRRRENNEDSLDKMKMMRQNLVKAYEILEWVTRREQRKTHIVVCSLCSSRQQLLAYMQGLDLVDAGGLDMNHIFSVGLPDKCMTNADICAAALHIQK